MDVTLMHNPKAGVDGFSKKELLREFERAGHEVDYYSTKSKKFARGLINPKGVVVVAGGDGTFKKIARRLIGRNVPIAILPLGTANNIARSLGVGKTDRRIIRQLASAREVKFDVGMARGPWGHLPFFEAVGAGLVPEMISHHASNEHNGVPDAVETHGGVRGGVHLLRKVLDDMRGREFTIKLDVAEFTGKYLLIEAMNIPSIGPGFALAPHAHPGDGRLDVVIVRENQRRDLARHVAGDVAKENRAFKVHRTRRLVISCASPVLHLDDELWPASSEKLPQTVKPIARSYELEIEIFPGALRLLIPK